MKKCNFIFLIVLSLSFFSCKTVHQVLANQKFNDRVGIEELSRPVNNNIIPFTLNNKADYGCPVVCMEINNQKALFLVDTGFPKTIMISDNGLKKLNIDLETFKSSRLDDYLYFLKENFPQKYNKIKDNPKKLKKQLYKDLKKGLAFFNLNYKNNYFKYFDYGQIYDSKIDGVIGLEYLKQYKRVTFDFINNYMILGDDRIDGVSTDMFEENHSGEKHLFINFLYKGKKEVGLLDTGNYTFSPRNNFGKDEYHYNFDFEVNDAILDEKLKKKAPFVQTYNDIEICGLMKNKIKGVYSNIWFSTYSKTVQILLTKVNGIGCELFRDNVIQFDFENNEFIMTEKNVRIYE